MSPLADEWSPDELIYIRYNPVYGRSENFKKKVNIG